jgi:hypothetical protein
MFFINWIIVLAVLLVQGRLAPPERNRRSLAGTGPRPEQTREMQASVMYRLPHYTFLFRTINLFSLEILMHIFSTEKKKGDVESEQRLGLNHVIL